MLAQRGAIEAHAGLALRDADPEALRLVVERSRQAGNDAFRRRKYPGARVAAPPPPPPAAGRQAPAETHNLHSQPPSKL
jgi:hypothetical protein